MPLVVEPLDDRRKKWRACEHADLFFGSGGHFIWCKDCGAEWTASYDGGKYDDNRAGPILDTQVHRVIANRLPRS